MREELTVDASTGETARREYTPIEDQATEDAARQWREAMAARERDILLLKERASGDEVFAALLRVIGVG